MGTPILGNHPMAMLMVNMLIQYTIGVVTYVNVLSDKGTDNLVELLQRLIFSFRDIHLPSPFMT